MKTIRHIGILSALIIFSMHTSQLLAQSSQDIKAEQKAAQEAELKAKKEMLEQQHIEMRDQEIKFKEQQIMVEELAQFKRNELVTSQPRVIYRTPRDSEPYF